MSDRPRDSQGRFISTKKTSKKGKKKVKSKTKPRTTKKVPKNCDGFIACESWVEPLPKTKKAVKKTPKKTVAKPKAKTSKKTTGKTKPKTSPKSEANLLELSVKGWKQIAKVAKKKSDEYKERPRTPKAERTEKVKLRIPKIGGMFRKEYEAGRQSAASRMERRVMKNDIPKKEETPIPEKPIVAEAKPAVSGQKYKFFDPEPKKEPRRPGQGYSFVERQERAKEYATRPEQARKALEHEERIEQLTAKQTAARRAWEEAGKPTQPRMDSKGEMGERQPARTILDRIRK